MKKYFVTGVAGFIGMHVAQELLNQGHTVFGVDNINDYYDTKLKYGRLNILFKHPKFKFEKMDIAKEHRWMEYIFREERFDYVIHLAAQAGVRYSMENPHAYIHSNVNGFINILEICKNFEIQHLLYASSSSVYGNLKEGPFREDQDVNEPISTYAATKRTNELMAHTYSHLYKLPTTGVRFFTVYGPWGRPDMAPFLFADAIIKGEPIKLFNGGDMLRDFTYIDDIVKGVVDLVQHIPKEEKPYKIFNIGNGNPIMLDKFVMTIENALGMAAEKINLPMQDGDVYMTYADTTKLEKEINFKPMTSLENGIKEFIQWFSWYYYS